MVRQALALMYNNMVVNRRYEGMENKKIASPVEHRFDLIDPDALLAMAKVMHEGAKDHTPEGWRNMSTDDILNHALIHIILFMTGRDDGEDHLANAMTRLMMAWATKERDSRLKSGSPKRSIDREVIYLSYPYADDPEMRTKVITRVAADVYWGVSRETGDYPVIIVPHLMFPFLAEDLHRDLILSCCVSLVDLCTRMIVVGKHVSNGMEREINRAKERGIPISDWPDEGAKEKVLNYDREGQWPPGSDPALVVQGQGSVSSVREKADVSDAMGEVKEKMEIPTPRVPRYPTPSVVPGTCGECGACVTTHQSSTCGGDLQDPLRYVFPRSAPPDWCPKRVRTLEP